MSDHNSIDPNLFKTVIATGGWQLTLGWIILALSLFAMLLGSVPAGGAGLVIANALLFWGAMIRMFHVVEAKLVLLITNPLYRGGQAGAFADDAPAREEARELAKSEAATNSRWLAVVALIAAAVIAAVVLVVLKPA